MKKRTEPRMQSLAGRRSLVSIDDFAVAVPPSQGMRRFLDSLPRILAGNEFMKLVRKIVEARRPALARKTSIRRGALPRTGPRGSEVVMALGGHVVKCGLSPLVIDLMRRRIVTAVAMNGATAVHDYEIAKAGKTSEDVEESIKDGSFGMTRETGEAFALACDLADRGDLGLGEALGLVIAKERCAYAGASILAAGLKYRVPVTVHVAIGTDIVHMHAGLSGSALGKAALRDFHRVVEIVGRLENGLWMNVGSAVILPEVFLKAISLARNLGAPLRNVTTANLDMIQHYRPRVNVVGRPVATGISLTGHHEIMLPLLRAAVLCGLSAR